jgi:exopolyphosphatase/guanosine-5'-triphosphate,3'-diphosphate pyrophosphatase
MRSLKQHVYETLEKSGVRPLQADERLVGTGGTVRNLAKIDRRLLGDYPISRLHGYVVDRRRLDEVGSLVASAAAGERARVPGLNADRADSIVGGALIVQSVMDRLLASTLTVAGYGLREGVALRSVTREVASIAEVRAAAMSTLGRRFSDWDPRRAEQRAGMAARLLRVLAPGLDAETLAAADCAARLLDVGASIDHYRRFAHSARIVADANLDAFSHRTVALVSAALLAVGEREASVKGYAPLLATSDMPVVEQIAAAVGLAEALVRYGSGDVDHATAERSNGHVAVDTPLVDAWPLDPPARRAERAFGIRLEFTAGAGVAARAS